MSHATELDRVWQIIEKVGVCMLTTRFGGGLRARPLEARPDRKSDVTDVSSAKRDEVDRWPEVGLVFIDAADKAYLSITGKAQIADDPDLRAAAWRKNDVVWWPGGPNERRETLTTVFRSRDTVLAARCGRHFHGDHLATQRRPDERAWLDRAWPWRLFLAPHWLRPHGAHVFQQPTRL